MFRKSRRQYPDHFISRKLCIRKSDVHGIGVFAAEPIEAHELIEASPVILFHMDTAEALTDFFGVRHVLMDYPFQWNGTTLAFALGFGGIYNHLTRRPNAGWKCNFETESLDFYSRCAIPAGDEIFIRYLSHYQMDRLWFYESNEKDVPDK